jgi:hypothetical protein|tara:strand:+ start:320 stop:676 length:357 start_codon:yes stop_codon:yes gene_type:complete
MPNIPEYTATQSKIERPLALTESLEISFWFNIDDADLRARLNAYYEANKDDWKKQPGLELQVKAGGEYHRICRSRLWLNKQKTQNAPPPPIPAVSMEPSLDPAPPPPPPMGYSEAKDG